MEKDLYSFSKDKGMQDAVRAAFEATLEEQIISRVMQGLDVVGYREARDIMRQTIKRVVVEYSEPKRK
jgi:hypothetical protein